MDAALLGAMDLWKQAAFRVRMPQKLKHSQGQPDDGTLGPAT